MLIENRLASLAVGTNHRFNLWLQYYYHLKRRHRYSFENFY
jgi:hypothetical protein